MEKLNSPRISKSRHEAVVARRGAARPRGVGIDQLTALPTGADAATLRPSQNCLKAVSPTTASTGIEAS